MDCRERKCVQNPYESASLLSKLFFLWVLPLFRKGVSKDLSLDDLYDVPIEDVSNHVTNQVEQAWEKVKDKAEKSGKQPKYYKALIGSFGSSYLISSLGLLFDECVIRVAQPLFLRELIRSFSDSNATLIERGAYASGVCITALIRPFIFHSHVFKLFRIGMKCRLASSSLIYKKILKLSKESLDQVSPGKVVNLIGNDIGGFDITTNLLPFLAISPLQTAILTYILWKELGPSCLAGLAVITFLIPFQFYFGVISRKLKFQLSVKTDARGKILSEVLNAIRVIKMYAWESAFAAVIVRARHEESNYLQKRKFFKSLFSSLSQGFRKLYAFLVFVAYILCGHNLSADKVFFTIAVFDIIGVNMVSILPNAAAALGELFASLNRVESLLLLEEKAEEICSVAENSSTATHDAKTESTRPCLKMTKVCAKWSRDEIQPFLKNLDVDLSRNEMVMVVGPVGCGKSAFLQTVLQELRSSSGSSQTSGRLSYCSQDPWIFSGTIRQNILFGKEYEKAFFDSVISASILDSDLREFPNGDLTYVGERGIMLSGGQKARVNLARALYNAADIYLLDDPLSAVDTRVSRQIFERCIIDHLRERLRILVTHQLQYLPYADHIIVMSKGQIIAQGSYVDLLQQGVDFVSLVSSIEETEPQRKASLVQAPKKRCSESCPTDSESYPPNEQMSSGSVSWRTYWAYIRSGSSLIAIALLSFSFLLAQALTTAADLWISVWTNEEESSASANHHQYYIVIYGSLVLALAVTTALKLIFFFQYCLRSSTHIHNQMFSSLVRAPISYFDITPSGRIMNRFTKDVGLIDDYLPACIVDVINLCLVLIGVMSVVIWSNFYVLAPSLLFLVFLVKIHQFYIKTSRDIKRLEAISRSPVFTHITATMQGVTTIRALKKQLALIRQFDALQDDHSSAWFLFISTNRWFEMTLDFISACYLTIATCSFLVVSNNSMKTQAAESANIGLAISSILGLSYKFQWGMRQSSELENYMISVERCLEYVQLSPEKPIETDRPLPEAWPGSGSIQFSNVSLAYGTKKVLEDLSFEIKSKERIGIVGRTGAGKSSIIAALFRMADEISGDIYFDGVSTADLGLLDLRQNISIIPQDPVLYSGSVRHNLDPFNKFEDADVWKVIEDVFMKEVIPALDMQVNDGGSNFSLGQRQLLCLARAILRDNRVIVMDEATANVDPQTDRLIQQTIREKFADCTIITIAHRLQSVMDCDRILVLERGRIQEFDHPHMLLQNPEGLLSTLARHTGSSSLNCLRAIAAAAFEKKLHYDCDLKEE